MVCLRSCICCVWSLAYCYLAYAKWPAAWKMGIISSIVWSCNGRSPVLVERMNSFSKDTIPTVLPSLQTCVTSISTWSVKAPIRPWTSAPTGIRALTVWRGANRIPYQDCCHIHYILIRLVQAQFFPFFLHGMSSECSCHTYLRVFCEDAFESNAAH